jgi:hypothetical protein
VLRANLLVLRELDLQHHDFLSLLLNTISLARLTQPEPTGSDIWDFRSAKRVFEFLANSTQHGVMLLGLHRDLRLI